MSLEQALAANTAALQALTAALDQNRPTVVAAPFTAAVAPVPTVPVASTDSSPAPTTAFAQPAQTAPQPAATVAPPIASPAAGVERDSKGMPWDGRIHSATKAKVADGSWRYKRGSGETYINQVEAEIRAAQAAPVPTVHAVTPAGIGEHVAPTGGPAFAPHPFYDQPAGPVAAPAAPAVVATPPVAAHVAVPVPPAAPVTTGITTYDALMAALPPKIVSGELSATQMQQACETYGVPSIAALSARPDLVPFIAATLKL